MNIDDIRNKLASFAAARNWDQFHTPKNLSMALAAEAAEAAEPATLTGGQAPFIFRVDMNNSSRMSSRATSFTTKKKWPISGRRSRM